MCIDAYRAPNLEDKYLEVWTKKYGEIETYFGLPIYLNPIGIEVEMEKAAKAIKGSSLQLWRVEEDGSLKDQGYELVSNLLHNRHIDYALHELKLLFEKGPEIEFGHRCSIHVHVNVSEFTKYQLIALTATYAVLEESYFAFAEPLRRGNSYCYPLTSTEPPTFFVSDITKYCAFNTAPIKKQLTVEFRHLEGTKDIQKIRRWVALVTKLVNHVGALDPKICIPYTTEKISSGAFPEYIKEIYGNTHTLFDTRILQKSIKNGELWALAYLSGAE